MGPRRGPILERFFRGLHEEKKTSRLTALAVSLSRQGAHTEYYFSAEKPRVVRRQSTRNLDSDFLGFESVGALGSGADRQEDATQNQLNATPSRGVRILEP
jgi:hypothetical protein